MYFSKPMSQNYYNSFPVTKLNKNFKTQEKDELTENLHFPLVLQVEPRASQCMTGKDSSTEFHHHTLFLKS